MQIISSHERLKSIDGIEKNLLVKTITDDGKIGRTKIDNQPLKTPIIVIRFSQFNCSTCVESLLEVIKDKLPERLHSRVLLLPNYVTTLYLNEFLKRNNLAYPMYNLKDSDINLVADKAGLPFLFVMMEMDFAGVGVKEHN